LGLTKVRGTGAYLSGRGRPTKRGGAKTWRPAPSWRACFLGPRAASAAPRGARPCTAEIHPFAGGSAAFGRILHGSTRARHQAGFRRTTARHTSTNLHTSLHTRLHRSKPRWGEEVALRLLRNAVRRPRRRGPTARCLGASRGIERRASRDPRYTQCKYILFTVGRVGAGRPHSYSQ